MKSNIKPWLYGPDWEGQRCIAKTRKGTQCQRPAGLPVGRCRLHGGASTGPRTKEGLARLTEARTKNAKLEKKIRDELKTDLSDRAFTSAISMVQYADKIMLKHFTAFSV